VTTDLDADYGLEPPFRKHQTKTDASSGSSDVPEVHSTSPNDLKVSGRVAWVTGDCVRSWELPHILAFRRDRV
jgi:hypothetical protein